MSNDILSFKEVLDEYIHNIVVGDNDGEGFKPVQHSPLYWLLKYSNLHREYHWSKDKPSLIRNLNNSIWNRFFYANFSPADKTELLLKAGIDISEISGDEFRELSHNEIEELYFFITKGLRKYDSHFNIDFIKLDLINRSFEKSFPKNSYWNNSIEIYDEETETYNDELDRDFRDRDADFQDCILQNFEFSHLKFYGLAKFEKAIFVSNTKFDSVEFLGGVTLPPHYKRIIKMLKDQSGILDFCLEKDPLPETFEEFVENYISTLRVKESKEIDGKIYHPAEHEPLYWFLVYDKLYAYFIKSVSGLEQKSIWNSFHYGHLSADKFKELFPSAVKPVFMMDDEITKLFHFVREAIKHSCVNLDRLQESFKKIDALLHAHDKNKFSNDPVSADLDFKECYFETTEVFGENLFAFSLCIDNLSFTNCFVDGDISASFDIKNNLLLENSNFIGKVSLFYLANEYFICRNKFASNVLFENIGIEKEACIIDNCFHKNLYLILDASSNFEFVGNQLHGDLIYSEQQDNKYNNINNNVISFKENIFHKNSSLDLSHATFKEKVSFAGTDFSHISYLDFTNTSFEKGIDLQNVSYPLVENPKILTNKQANAFYDSYEFLRHEAKDYPMREKDLFARGLYLWVYVKNYRDRVKMLSQHLSRELISEGQFQQEKEKLSGEKVKRSPILAGVVSCYNGISDCGQDITKPMLLFAVTILGLSNLYIFSSLYEKKFLLLSGTVGLILLYGFLMAREKDYVRSSLKVLVAVFSINMLTFFGLYDCNFAPLRLAVFDAVPVVSMIDNETYQKTIIDTILPKDWQYVLNLSEDCDSLSDIDCAATARELDLWEIEVKEKYEVRRHSWYPTIRFFGKIFSYLSLFLIFLGIRNNTRMREN